MFDSVLIANRGEIAVRIARTARRMGLRVVAVYSDADRDALHVAVADEAIRLGPAPARDSYLRIDAVLDAARRSGAQAIHPGYGFLSENPDFVEAVEAAGLIFVGPPSSAIRAMGLKDAAKALMQEAGVPIVPGYHGRDQDPGRLAAAAEAIGYPVLIKAAAGGGGKGMRRVDEPARFAEALAAAQREAASAFGDNRVLVERCLVRPRHIEIQVFADAHGRAVHLFERDCSLQRRHQKVIEEAPAPGMPTAIRASMGAAAVRAAQAVGYRGAGTVEFIVDAAGGLRPDGFYFMEMNTRLQVEHPVTEAITGLDLVEWQFRVAAGEPLPLGQDDLAIAGHAIEARLYAEDPAQGFLPQTGRLDVLALYAGPGLRIDTGARQGDLVTPFYDPMLAKVVAHGATRAEALARLRAALGRSRVEGCLTNLVFLERVLALPAFAKGEMDTDLIGREFDALLEELAPPRNAVALAALEAAGLLTPSSGADPFDSLASFRLWGGARKEVALQVGTEVHRLTTLAAPDGVFLVMLKDETMSLRLVGRDGDTLRIENEGRISEVRVVRQDDNITVRSQAGLYRFALPKAAAGAFLGGPQDGAVRATMPGIVRLLHVVPGQRVSLGDALVVTEAMKMELTLSSTQAGRVASIDVAEGDQVQSGTVLMTIEAADG